MSQRICIIPARGGSRRLPRKNIRMFHGRPIIAYSISNAQSICDRVVVSTEDAEIAQVARDFGAEVHQRSFDMARDDVGTQVVAKYVADELQLHRRDTLLVLYPCAPLVMISYIGYAIHNCGDGYAVAVGADPLRDAGTFYVGKVARFRDGKPLWQSNTRAVTLPPQMVCDINTEEDWQRCEQLYAEQSQVTVWKEAA